MQQQSLTSLPRRALTLAAIGILAAYSAIALWYGRSASYFDPAEPTVTAVSYALGAGHSLYPALDAPERIAHVWGPALFLIHATVMALVGASIGASKAIGVGAALLSLTVSVIAFRRYAGLGAALVTSSLCALVYLGFSNVTFWTRSDPLLLLCSALSLIGATCRRRTAAALWIGVALGFAVNLKITGVFYVLPVLAVLSTMHGVRALALAIGVGLAVAAGPFFLRNVSLVHYLEYLQLSAKNGIVVQKVRQNLQWAAFLGSPLALLWWRGRRISGSANVDSRFVGVLAVSMVIVALLAAKEGGGPFHLLPFVPVLAFGALSRSETWRSPSSLAVAVLAAVTIVMAVRSQRTFIRTVDYRNQDRVLEDLRRAAASEAGRTLAVGYAGVSYVSYARPEIVFRTRDYWLDAPAIQEHQRVGISLPPATLRRLDECYVETWLIPKMGEPFAVPNVYLAERRDVFPAEFRETFHRRYERTGSTEFFDVWRCRR